MFKDLYFMKDSYSKSVMEWPSALKYLTIWRSAKEITVDSWITWGLVCWPPRAEENLCVIRLPPDLPATNSVVADQKPYE